MQPGMGQAGLLILLMTSMTAYLFNNSNLTRLSSRFGAYPRLSAKSNVRFYVVP